MAWKWDVKPLQADKGLYDLDRSTLFVRGSCLLKRNKHTIMHPFALVVSTFI